MKYIIVLILFNISSYSLAQQSWWVQSSNDSIIATSTNNALAKFSLKKERNRPVIIAVIDSDFNLKHSSFDNIIWNNIDEIPNNNIDDDHNGYIDDTRGWNFLGKKVDENMLTYTLTEETRILQKYDSVELNKLFHKNIYPYKYSDVKNSYDTGLKNTEELYIKYKQINEVYTYYLPELKKMIPDSIKTINSTALKNINIKDSILNIYRNYFITLYDTGYPPDVIEKKEEQYKNLYTICFDLEKDNRVLIGDEQENIKDTRYGSNVFGSSTDILVHGTKMAGAIAIMIEDDTTSVAKEVIKIMQLTISGYGNYLDKDLALAIRYAVDNGASVINISQSKDFSINPRFIEKAIKYAAKHNVLIINSAGNDRENTDISTLHYPNDFKKKFKEISKNFMVVGASNKSKKNLLNKTSNYGKNTVDIFAPGENIKTLNPSNKEVTGSGTSYATVITSSIAALIRSHYPSLTASEVKQILMDSAVRYDILVDLPTKENPDQKVPFSSLSKSGGIVNAYNALLLAEKVVNEKK